MSDPARPSEPVSSPPPLRTCRTPDDMAVCERRRHPKVYRMHGVWRCADCAYKTDCCGW